MLDEIESDSLNSILKKDYSHLLQRQKPLVEKIFTKFNNEIDIKIIEDFIFGLNFVFINFTGEYYFPAAMWYSQSYKNTKSQLVNLVDNSDLGFIELQKKIFELIFDKVKNRKGYSKEIMEQLKNYLKIYDELNQIEIKTQNDVSNLYKKGQFQPTFSKDGLNYEFTAVKQTIGTYLIPKNAFWNLGSILLDPSFDYNEYNESYPLFPYWLLNKGIDKENKRLFSLNRVSPTIFGNNFDLKDQIVNSINFFINFKFFEPSKSDLYVYSLPDLFKTYDAFEQINNSMSTPSSNEFLNKPDWFLSMKSPKKIQNQNELLNRDELENVNSFLLDNLDVTIHLFNNYMNTKDVNLFQIFRNFERKNIFNDLFSKRLRLDKNNLNINCIIWLKIKKTKHFHLKIRITNFFSYLFPTGIIIDYQSGIMLLINTYHRNSNKFYNDLDNFLEFFDLEYKIFKKHKDYGFLLYSLPPSILFFNNEWHFPNSNLDISINEFRNKINKTLEKEKIFGNKHINKMKIKNFKEYLKNL